MKRLLSLVLTVAFVLLYGGACIASEINRSEPFDLIEYCENHEIHSEDELEDILYPYIGDSDPTNININNNQNTLVSFDLTIDYENQYIITTSVYEESNLRGSKSGYAEKKYRSSSG
jgi:hypothetical protein